VHYYGNRLLPFVGIREILLENGGKTLTSLVCRGVTQYEILKQVYGILRFYRIHKIVHGDLHISNLVINHGHVKAIDFGSMMFLDDIVAERRYPNNFNVVMNYSILFPFVSWFYKKVVDRQVNSILFWNFFSFFDLFILWNVSLKTECNVDAISKLFDERVNEIIASKVMLDQDGVSIIDIWFELMCQNI
jgi:serine/threonine protein kinase